MLFRAVLGISAFMALSAAALAEDCPTLNLQEQEQLLSKAPSCDQAMKLFEACQHGTSGDVGLGDIVIKKCEGAFLVGLSKSDRTAYDHKIKACWRKYAKKSGTMYRSFEAFCAAGVAQAYARRMSPGKRQR